MLQTRILSALVILPVVLFCAWFGHPWLTVLVAFVLSLGALEFARLGRRAGHSTAPAIAVAIAGLLALERGFCGGRYQPLLLALALLAPATWYVFHARLPTRLEAWGLTFLAALYVGFLGSHFVALRAMDNGFWWLALGVATVWISDTGAYLVGRLWGSRRMAPHISPRKTWEGAVAGLLAALAAGLLLSWPAGVATVHGLAIGAIVGVVSPLGDLAISVIKRQVGVKDSSNLIPGHGGMLDRLDSLLFAAPLVYYYACLVAVPPV